LIAHNSKETGEIFRISPRRENGNRKGNIMTFFAIYFVQDCGNSGKIYQGQENNIFMV
jgi:hypothetical protein